VERAGVPICEVEMGSTFQRSLAPVALICDYCGDCSHHNTSWWFLLTRTMLLTSVGSGNKGLPRAQSWRGLQPHREDNNIKPREGKEYLRISNHKYLNIISKKRETGSSNFSHIR
jgi:hypothetical protein